jgi:hypothetical protein
MAAFRNGVLAASLSIGFLTASSIAAPGPPPKCEGVCSTSCVKPIAIPDRWDDFSVMDPKTGKPYGPWSGNGIWDGEKFTDTNGNRYYDAGEPFQDGTDVTKGGSAGPKDGKYDGEYYHPFNTGYVAWKDLGLELNLKYGNPGSAEQPSQYYPIDLPGSIGGNDYRNNWENCNPSMISVGDVVSTEFGDMQGPTAQSLRDLINQDPDARWNPHAQRVISHYPGQSPRVIIIPAFDPRIPLNPGKQDIVVTKLLAFFLESADASGHMTGRLVWIRKAGGTSCPDGGGFVVDCPGSMKTESDAAPTVGATWGALKAIYR